MRHNKIFRFLLSTAILLLSCQLFSLNSPVEIRQSATTASSKPNTYVDAEYGVTLTYPRGWRTATDPDALVAFVSPDGSVYIYLYTIPASSDLTLELLSTQIRGDLSSLSDLTYLEDSSTELTDGKSAWVIEATAANADNTRIKIGFSFSIFGSYAYIMQAVATINAYDYYTEDISALFSAMHLEIPETYETYGIPRDQGLFLASGESTNPRDYDPATTHSGGDKLVFSGLVSFDPHLNLRAELAETWEISSDGTIYTFHLRTDAHFHDGRLVTAQDFVYSWQRAADPTTQSDTVLTYLGDIVGVAEMHNGQAQHISGLQALDDHTLQVTIDEPKPYFLMKLTYPTAFVVDRENVESGSEWYRNPTAADRIS